MTKKRLLLAEQHIRRGVDANALIAAHLNERSVDTRLCLMSGSQLKNHIIRYKPHLVYWPWITPKINRFLSERAPEVPVVNSFQEQGILFHREKSGMVGFADRSDYIFAWSEELAARMKETYEGVEIVVTGNPRMDPYVDRKLAAHAYPTREEIADRYGLDSDKRWVLLALDFSMLFASEEWIGRFLERQDLTREGLAAMEDIYQRLAGWVERLADDLDDEAVVIVRPHPGSDLEQIKADFGGRGSESIRYIKGGVINPWILCCDAYMTRISTSIIEAWIVGMPTAAICKKRTLEAAVDLSPHIYEVNNSVENYGEFRAFVTGQGWSTSEDMHKTFLEKFCGELDGQASRRTANALERIVEGQEYRVEYEKHWLENCRECMKYEIKKLLVESGLNRLNPLNRPNDMFLSQGDVAERVSVFRKMLQE